MRKIDNARNVLRGNCFLEKIQKGISICFDYLIDTLRIFIGYGMRLDFQKAYVTDIGIGVVASTVGTRAFPEWGTEAKNLNEYAALMHQLADMERRLLEKSDTAALKWQEYYEQELERPLLHEGGSMAPMERSLRGYRLQLGRIQTLKNTADSKRLSH